MKSLHWLEFVPATSKVDGFHGGIHPPYTGISANSGEESFCAITYRLQVAEAQNGFHHFMSMYTGLQGAAYANGCVKEACRPGSYQIMLHFNFLTPQVSQAADFRENSYKISMFFGQDIDNPRTQPQNNLWTAPVNYSTANVFRANANYPSWVNNAKMDVMVFRPSLVDPTDANSRVDLWKDTAYDGWQMFFTGFPLADPNIVLGSNYEL